MFILYQTTCLVNGKKYIGIHQQDKDDDYLGSGKWFLRAVRKYGKENFVRETLFTFDNREDAYKKELEVVNEEIVNDPNYYNMRLGGRGGRAWIDSEDRQKICEKMKQNWSRTPERLERLRTQNIGRKLTEDHKKALRKGASEKNTKTYRISKPGEPVMEMTMREFCERFDGKIGSARTSISRSGKYKGYTFT